MHIGERVEEAGTRIVAEREKSQEDFAGQINKRREKEAKAR
jgi:hypothetical protein